MEENKNIEIEETISFEDETEAEVSEAEVLEAEETSEEASKSKGQIKKNIKASFASRKFKGGAYATILSVVVIALLVLINVVISKFDVTVDLTTNSMYSITDTTREFLAGISDDITLYHMVTSGEEDALVEQVLNQMDAESDNIEVVKKDPIQYPKFVEQYVTNSDEFVANSVIVVNNTNGKAKLVKYTDMIVTNYDYSTWTSTTTSDVEGQIDSGIQYVTNEELPVMYAVTGHGEVAVSAVLGAMLEKENVEYQMFETLVNDSIPEDCSVLLINQPTSDYTEEEVAYVKEYLQKGGNAIVIVSFASYNLPNFTSLLNYYGIDMVEGIVVEADSKYYRTQTPLDLLPAMATHDITSGIKGKKYVVMPYAMGLETRDDIRSTITVTDLMTTSKSAYSKTDLSESSTLVKTKEDIEGPFVIAKVVEEEYNDVFTKLVVYGSYYMTYDTYISYASFGNGDVLLNTVNYLAGVENSLSVRTVDLSAQETLTLTAAEAKIVVAIFMVIIPLAALGTGIFVAVKRRKK